jgi:hypothetical protein
MNINGILEQSSWLMRLCKAKKNKFNMKCWELFSVAVLREAQFGIKRQDF